LMFATVLLVSTGATIFFLTKAPDDVRLYQEGVKQLADGQYAFAVTTLNSAAALRPKDARIYLALARAYVGIDQVNKAWDCVNHAQQLGSSVSTEPALASDLANYYRQHGDFERAINLLRPLAKANVAGKRAELADLAAAWGDEALRNGKTEMALRCWEEVHELNDGSRASEAESRLATIYQKMANKLASNEDQKDDEDALKYLNKLNNIAQNPHNYELAADLYEKQKHLELAIDQLRKAHELSGKNLTIERKLADLLSRRGKELLDEGNTDAGYGYLQQAKQLSPENSLPAVALRNLSVTSNGGMPRITGDVWNPTDNSINSLTMKVELFDTNDSRVLWTKDVRVIDEFVPALAGHASKSFDVVSGEPSRGNGTAEFRIYLDGNLYKEYPIGEKRTAGRGDDSSDSQPSRTAARSTSAPPVAPQRQRAQAPPPVAPPIQAVPAPAPTVETPPVVHSGPSSEEKTMKDLDQ
jgi:tetratricopeptide (TPR) repeat protein